MHLPAGSTTSACSSLGFCLNFMFPMFKMEATILNMDHFSSSLKPKTAIAFYGEGERRRECELNGRTLSRSRIDFKVILKQL